MNKIYKVIWSKVKHQYVVVSELAHSNGKQSRTAKRSLRSRIAALVVCGAIAAFGVLGITEQQAFAAPEGGIAEIDQYIAYKTEIGTTPPDGYYKVNIVAKNDPNHTAYYMVRDGFSVDGAYIKKQDGTGYTFVITKVYAPDNDLSGTLISSKVTVDGTDIVTNSGEELNKVALGNYAAVSNGGWTASTNNGAVTTDITNDDKVDFANTDGNIAVNQTAVKDDKGNITGTNLTFDLNPDITLDAETADNNSVKLSGTGGYIQAVQGNSYTDIQGGTVKIGSSDREGTVEINGTTGQMTGLSNTTWDGTTDNASRAATEGQLEDLSDTVNTGWYVADKNTAEDSTTGNFAVKPGETLTFNGDDNIDVEAKDHEVNVSLNDNITLGEGNSQININGNPENGEAALSIGDKFVVEQNGTTTIVANDGIDNRPGQTQITPDTTVTIAPSGVTFTGDDKGTTIIEGQKITAGGIVINGEDVYDETLGTTVKGTITGLSNTTWDGTTDNESRVATEGQLEDLSDTVNTGWYVADKNTAEDSTTGNFAVKPGETLTFNGDDNIDVEAKDHEVNVSLNDNITLGEGNSQININGNPENGEAALSIGDKFVVEQNGTTTIVANDGIDNRPGQTQITPDTTVTIAPSGVTFTGDDKGTTIIEGQKITAGGIVINGEDVYDETLGTTVKGTITGLSNTTWDGTTDNESRVATEGQLEDLSDTVNTGWYVADKNTAEDSTTGNFAVKPGETLTFNGDDNIDVEAKDHEVNVSLNDNITLGEGNSQININGNPENGEAALSIGDKFVVEQNGTTTIVANDGIDNRPGQTQITPDTTVTIAPSGVTFTGDDKGTTIIEGQKITAGGIVINGEDVYDETLGTTVKGTITGLSNTTWDGTTDNESRVATEGQLEDLSDTVNTGWYVADKNTAEDSTTGNFAVKPGETLTFNGDDNIDVEAKDHEVNVSLNDNITLGEGNSQININGNPENGEAALSIGDKFVVEQNGTTTIVANDGIDNRPGQTQITPDTTVTIAPSGVTFTGDDKGTTIIEGQKITAGGIVINGEDVYDETLGTTVKGTITGLSNTTWDGTTDNESRVATEGQLEDLSDTVNTGWYVADKNTAEDSTTGNFAVKPGETLTFNGDDNIDVEAKDHEVNVSLNDNITLGEGNSQININGNPENGEAALSIGDKFVVEQNGTTTIVANDGIDNRPGQTQITPDTTVTIAPSGVTFTGDDKGTTIIEGQKITAGGIVINGEDVYDETLGTTVKGTITGLSNTTWDGTTDNESRVATEGQLEDLSDTVNTGWYVADKNTAEDSTTGNFAVKPGETLTFNGDDNIDVEAKDHEVNVSLNDNITLGEGNSQININGNPENGEAALSIGDKFVVEQNGTTTIVANDGIDNRPGQTQITPDTTVTIAPSGVTFTGDDKGTTIIEGQKITAGGIVINGEDVYDETLGTTVKGTITGLSNTTWDGTTDNESRVATEGQLEDLSDTVNTGWYVADKNTAEDSTTGNFAVKPGETLTFNGDDNIDVEAKDHEVNVSLNDNITLGEGNSQININGNPENGEAALSIGDKFVVEQNGTTTIVANDGIDNRPGQTQITPDTTVTIAPSGVTFTGDDKGTTIIEGQKITAGGIVINGEDVYDETLGTTVKGTITGLSNTTWDGTTDNESRVATEGQLEDLSDTVNTGWYVADKNTAEDSTTGNFAVKPGETLTFNGDDNIDVEAKDHEVNVSLNDNITLGEGNSQININGNPENGEAALSIGDKFVVEQNGTTTIVANDGIDNRPGQTQITPDTTVTIAPSGVTFTGDDKGTTIIEGQKITAGGIVINGEDVYDETLGTTVKGTITGLSNTTWDGTTDNESRVATEGQLEDLSDTVNTGWYVADKNTAEDSTTGNFAVKPGETLTFNGDDNIDVEAKDHEVNVSLNDNITLGEGNSQININGNPENGEAALSIGDKFVVEQNGTTTIVANDGIDNRPGQTQITPDTTVTIAPSGVTFTGDDKGTTIIEGQKITAGGIVINGEDVYDETLGTTVKGTITGLSNTTWDGTTDNESRVATEGQLEDLSDTVNTGWYVADKNTAEDSTTGNFAVKPGETLTFNGDDNIDVEAKDHEVNVSLNDNITLGEGNSQININGNPENGEAALSIGDKFVVEQNGTTTIVANDGIDNRPGQTQITPDTTVTIAPSGVTFTGDDKGTTIIEGQKITAGGIVINGEDVYDETLGTTVKGTITGLSNTTWDGTTDNESRVATEGQLEDLSDTVNTGWYVADKNTAEDSTTGNFAVKPGETLTFNGDDNIDVEAKDHEVNVSLNDNITLGEGNSQININGNPENGEAALSIGDKFVVEQNGTTTIVANDGIDNRPGQTQITPDTTVTIAPSGVTFTGDDKGTTIIEGQKITAGGIVINGEDVYDETLGTTVKGTITGLSNTTWDGTTDNESRVATEGQLEDLSDTVNTGWYVADKNTAEDSTTGNFAVKPGETLTFNGDDNIDVEAKDHEVNVSLNDNITLGEGNSQININGNPENGEAALSIGDKFVVEQNGTTTIVANDGIDNRPGQTQITPDTTVTIAPSGVTFTGDDKGTTIIEGQKITAGGIVINGEDVYDETLGTTVKGTITGLSNTTWDGTTDNESRVATEGQLEDLSDTVNTGWYVADKNTAEDSTTGNFAVKPGETLTFNGDDNIDVEAKDHEVNVSLNDNITLGEGNSQININGNPENGEAALSIGDKFVVEQNGTTTIVANDGIDNRPGQTQITPDTTVTIAPSGVTFTGDDKGTTIIEGQKITAGGIVINGEDVYDETLGTTVKGTITGLSNTTWDGTTDNESRVATEGQLEDLSDTVNTGWYVADKNTAEDSTTGNFAVKPGETLTFNGDDNIDVEAKDHEVNVSLNDNITLGEGNSQININGNPENGEAALSIGDKFVVEQNGTTTIVANDGIDNRPGQTQITPDTTVTIAPSGVTFTGDDKGTTIIEGQKITAGGIVINGEDVYDETLGTTVKGTITGLSNTTWDGTTDNESRVATEGQLEDLSDTVNTGWYVADKNTAEDSTTGNFAVKPGETLTFNGDDNIDVEAKDHEVNVSLNDNITLGEGNSQININGNPENGEAALSIGDKFVVEQNGTTTIVANDGIDNRPGQTQITPDTTVTIAPSGVTFTGDDKGTTIIEGQKITAGGIVINGEDVYDETLGTTVKGTITGLSNTTWDGTTDNESRVATEGQLEDLSDTVNTGWYVADKNTAEDSTTGNFAVKPGETLTFNGDDNIDVEAKDHEVNVSLNDNITLGEGNSQININGNPENGEAALSIGDKFVVEQNGTTTIVANDGIDNRPGQTQITPDTTVTIAPSGVTFTGDDKGTTIIEGQKITAGGIVINGEDVYDETLGTTVKGTITGLSNTTWDGTTDNESRVATEGQLEDLSDTVNTGWYVADKNTAEDSTTGNFAVKPGETLTFNGDDNIDVEAKDHEVNVSLNDNITLGEGNSQININGNPENGEAALSIGDKFVVEQNGTTTIVANDGIDNRPGQTQITPDTTVTIAPSGVTFTGDDKGTTIIEGQKITAGGIVINGEDVYDETLGTTVKGTITGLSNTTWDGTTDNESRVATEGQLEDLSDTVNTGWIATDGTTEVNVNPANNTLKFAGDNNITVTADSENNAINVKLNPVVTLDGNESDNNKVVLDGNNGTINATNTVKYGKGQGPGRTITNEFTFDNKGATFTSTTEKGHHDPVESSTNINGGTITTDTVKGLDNTTWNENIAKAVAEDKELQGVAATQGQLQTVDSKVNAGWIATDSQNHEVKITPDNNKLNFAGDENVTVTAANNEIKVALDDDIVLGEYLNNGAGVLIGGSSGTISATNSITVGEDQGLIIDGQKKEIQGLSNTTWNEKIANDAAVEGSTAASTAATQGQLQEVSKVANAGWTASDGTNSISVKPNETLNFVGDENLTVSADGTDKELKVSLNDDITLGDGENAIKIDGTDGTLNIGSTFAVAEDGTVLSDGDVIADADGEKYSLSEVGKYAVRYDKTNDGTSTITLVDGDDLSGTRIKNVADGVDPKDAVNVSQLEAVEATANAGWTASDGTNSISIKPNETLNFVGDENLTVSADGTDKKLKVSLNDDITLGNPKAGNTEGERSFTINTTDPEGYVPDSYKEENSSGAEFIKENGGFMLFATDTQGHGIFGVTAKGSAWAKDFKTYTTDIYGNNTQYSLNEVGDAVAQMSSYYNEENGKSYTVFSRYLNEAEKDKPFETVDKNATRDIPLALRDDGAVLIGATIKGEGFTDNGIRINAEIDDDGNNVATITGLENTTWTPPAPVATFAANDINTTSRAATEAQLNDLYNTVAAYDVNADGTVDYNHITLAGTPYNYGLSRSTDGTPTGGTSITNVAYASGNDGSEAVNVDYLKDTINKAVEAGGSISNSDKHLVANTAEGSNGVYKPNAEGNVNLIVSDEKGNSSTVTIGDVASKTELDSLKTNVGDLNYDKVTGDKLVNGDSVTTAIGKLDNKIDNISGTATDAANNTVTGGTIKDDGTVSLTQKDGDTIDLGGKLTDSGVVQEGTKFDGETGTLTITSQDKYNKGTSSVTVSGIASKDDIGTVNGTIGATSQEDLKDAYKDADKDGNATTEFITESGSMVEADVALDHAIQDVANTSYANDMVLSNRIDNVENRLGEVEERIDKVGAMAAAIANLRTMGYDPEAPTEVAVGVGQYKSETGIALGIFHYPNQDFMLSASISTSGDEVMGGIGATWRIGRKSAEEKAKDEEERILAKAEEIKQAAKRAEVKEQAERHAKLLAEREAKGEPIVPVEESAEQAQA